MEAEDYAAAAEARAEMDEIFQKDTVGALIEVRIAKDCAKYL